MRPTVHRAQLTLVAMAMALALACSRQSTSAHEDAATGDTSPDAAATDPLPSDACVARAPSHPAHGHEYTYVIDQIAFDYESNTTITGFNLDGRFSDEQDPHGCGFADYFTRYPDQLNCAAAGSDGICSNPTTGCAPAAPGCQGGIDNEVIAVVHQSSGAGWSASERIVDALAYNALVILIRVANIDDDVEDPSVDVYLYAGFPMFDSDCGHVAAGRTYAVDRSTVLASGGTIDEAVFHAIGSIHRGRLLVATCDAATFGVAQRPLSRWITYLSVPWHAIHLAADLHPDRLDRGAMGGWLRGDEMLALVRAMAPDYVNVLRDTLPGLMDIELDGICADPTSDRYGAMSFGFGTHAVAAVISSATPIADAPFPGACATPTPAPTPDVTVIDVPRADVPPLCLGPDGGQVLVDFQHDVDNCGSCGSACCVGEPCESGRCIIHCAATVCPAPSVSGRCSVTCTDLVADDLNCGFCGNGCAPGTHCNQSACR